MVTKKKTTHSLGASRIEKYYNKIVAAFVVLTAALVVLILYFSFSKTTIVVRPKEVPQELMLQTTVKEMGGTILLTDSEGTATYTDVDSTESRPGKATGTVTIVNNYTKDQPLAATTRLLSTEGVLFRTQEFVTVPAGGSVDAVVVADQEGASGDIGPSTFEIVALWEGLKEDIYATSKAPMTGGLVSVGVVTAEDIATVKADAQETVLAEAQTRFETEIATREGLPEEPFIPNAGSVVAVTTDVVSAQAGDQVGTVTATQGVTVALPVLDADLLLAFVQSQIDSQVPAGMKLESTLGVDDLAVTVDHMSEDLTDGDVTITVHAPLVVTADSEVLDRSNLVNKTAGEVESYLQTFSEVDSVSVEFSPFWVTRTPRLPDNITVKVEPLDESFE
jgi:hypothetical protein